MDLAHPSSLCFTPGIRPARWKTVSRAKSSLNYLFGQYSIWIELPSFWAEGGGTPKFIAHNVTVQIKGKKHQAEGSEEVSTFEYDLLQEIVYYFE